MAPDERAAAFGRTLVTDVNELPAAFVDRVVATGRRIADELHLFIDSGILVSRFATSLHCTTWSGRSRYRHLRMLRPCRVHHRGRHPPRLADRSRRHGHPVRALRSGFFGHCHDGTMSKLEIELEQHLPLAEVPELDVLPAALSPDGRRPGGAAARGSGHVAAPRAGSSIGRAFVRLRRRGHTGAGRRRRVRRRVTRHRARWAGAGGAGEATGPARRRGGNRRRAEHVRGWPLDDEASELLEDVSDAALGPDGRLYLLSDRSRRIARLAPGFPPGGDPVGVEGSWRLPKRRDKPEGLTFLPDGRAVVATDTKGKGPNLFILGGPIAT